MAETHFLNLRELAGEPVARYTLVSFHGREAISEPYDYTIDLHTLERPDLTKWIGKLAAFDVSPGYGQTRIFAGRIYAAQIVNFDGNPRIQVSIGVATTSTSDMTVQDLLHASDILLYREKQISRSQDAAVLLKDHRPEGGGAQVHPSNA